MLTIKIPTPSLLRIRRKSIRKILTMLASTTLPAHQFSELVMASFLVYRHCLGDSSAAKNPLALFLRSARVPSPRVYADFVQWGVTIPFTSHYLVSWRLPLPPRLKDFQSHAFSYPILFDPASPRSLTDRLSFFLSINKPSAQTIQAATQMIFDAMSRGEEAPGDALNIKIDPSQFDKIAVNNLLHSLGDTAQSKDS